MITKVFDAHFLKWFMVLQKGKGSLMNEVYVVVFWLCVNLSGDDHRVGFCVVVTAIL